MQDNSVEELIKRITSLEIDNRTLKKEVADLKQQVNTKQKVHVQRKSNDTTSTRKKHVLDEAERARRGIFLDRFERELRIGDEVYILTNGAHTSRSRRGTVTAFDNYRNRVYILDECQVTQERAPKNLRLDNRISS